MTQPKPEHEFPAGTTDHDIGDELAVPEDERLEADDYVPGEVNVDEGTTDFTDVPEGDVVVLSTAETRSPVHKAASA